MKKKYTRSLSDTLTKEKLEKDYEKLGSLKAIGRKYGVAGDTVKAYMQEYGLEIKPLVRYVYDEDFFTRENEETFYVAGFIAADGCVKRKRYDIQICLSKKDLCQLEMIKRLLKTDYPITETLSNMSERNPKWNNTWSVGLTMASKKLFNDLKKFNIVPAKTKIYTFPNWLIGHPLVHHFMRGYNDGDGSFYIHGTRIDKTTNRKVPRHHFSLRGTEKFLQVYRDILEPNSGLTIHCNLRENCGTHMLEYGGNEHIALIAKYLYKDATILMERKRNKVKQFL